MASLADKTSFDATNSQQSSPGVQPPHCPILQSMDLQSGIMVDLTVGDMSSRPTGHIDQVQITSGSEAILPSAHVSEHTDFDSEDEVDDETDIDVEEDKSDYAFQGSLAAYKPTYEIPSFQELHSRGTIELRDPVPGRLQFPGHIGPDGRHVPFKTLITDTQRRILPPQNEPLWKQMQFYCQRWGAWVATVEDEKRRHELMNWVTLRMKEAWEIGISLGHCGDPTGHNTCCSSHGPQNDSSGEHASSSQRKQAREIRKKPVDQSRQAAPFACEGNKLSHSIINRELESAGISMDTILEQMAQGLETGEALLADITKRLDGRSILFTDWTLQKAIFKHDPRTHSRNLFMYCLWEVQRCRSIIDASDILVDKPNATFNQQKMLQKRIEIHQQRAEQHLALAIVLDNRSPSNSEDSQNDTERENESEGEAEEFRRARKSASVIEIASDDNKSNSDMGESTRERSTSLESLSDDFRDHHGEADEEAVEADLKIPSLPMIKAEQCEDAGRNCAAVTDTRVSEEPAAKRCKVESKAACNNNPPNESLDLNYQAHYEQIIPSTTADYPARMSPQHLPDVKPIHQTQTNWRESTNDMEHPVEETYILPDEAVQKQMYTREVWQKRMNKILDANGFECIDDDLMGWPDIKDILQQIGFDESVRNQVLKDYKEDFETWKRLRALQQPMYHISPQQPAHDIKPQYQAQQPSDDTSSPISAPAPTQSTSPTSMDDMHTTRRGFAFRCFTNTTEAERERIDDAVMNYHEWVLQEKTNRFGFYVVFVDPKNVTKQVAHGLWNLTKSRRPDDAAWFYNNTPKPANFREHEPIYHHEWGHSIPPVNPRVKSKYTDQNSAADRQTSLDCGTGGNKIGKSKPTAHNPRKRRHVVDEEDSDDDYRPGAF